MNLRQVRKKIKSITNVKKITKAMQLVSAVKMKKAQQLAVEGRPYQEGLESIIQKVVPTVDVTDSPLLKHIDPTGKKELVILITANKGLCGAFNVNLFRLLMRKENMKQMNFITVGKKGVMFLSLTGNEVVADFSSPTPANETSAIFQMILKNFLEEKYAKISVIYNKFISTLRSESIKEILLPLTLQSNVEQKKQEVDYLIEPSKNELLDSLLKNYVEEKIRAAILNSEASEHSARMIAMKNATDNATEVVYNLTLLRNKLRQQKITYELLDMITAKESVEAN